MLTREQANLIARLVRTVRPSWDELHLTDVLFGIHDRDTADVAAAAVRAARDVNLRTPTGITFDGPHWHPTSGKDDRPARAKHREILAMAIRRCTMCDDHGYHDGVLCSHDPEAGERAKRGAEIARAAIRPGPTPKDPPAPEPTARAWRRAK